MDATTDADLGPIIRRARLEKQLTQTALGDACGYSQPVVSRLERGHRRATDMGVLRQISRVLEIPAHQLGLAEESPVNRREFMAAGIAVALPALPPSPEINYAAGIRHVTGTYRRLDSVMPGRDLVAPVTAHLALGRQLLDRTPDGLDRVDLAAAVSEAAGLAAWLEWDASNAGNARAHYLLAMKTARKSGHRLLSAYMTGSLATLAIAYHDVSEALALLRSARAQLGTDRSAIAEAWLACQEALAHATAGEARAADALLDRADVAVDRIQLEEPPPWPWVFAFDHAKVATCRLTCATRLRQPERAFAAAQAAGPSLGGHARQRALLTLDLAEAHLLAGAADSAFAIASAALEVAAPFASGRVADRARALRRSATGRIPAAMMAQFDDRLRAIAS